MTDPRTCEHFSIRSHGDIVCKLCGAVWVIDCSGSHWRLPIIWEGTFDTPKREDWRDQFEQQPFPEPTVADCRKGSCQRHGRCMYLNNPSCPIGNAV